MYTRAHTKVIFHIKYDKKLILIAFFSLCIYRFSKRYELPLVVQSIVMNITMFLMIHLCVKVKRSNAILEAKERVFSGKIASFSIFWSIKSRKQHFLLTNHANRDSHALLNPSSKQNFLAFWKGDERATIDSKENEVIGLPPQKTLKKAHSRHHLSGMSLYFYYF